MRILADTHVHIYPCHDRAKIFRCLLANLDTLAPCDLMGMFLTERHDCHAFETLASLSGAQVGSGLEVVPTDEPECLALFQNDWPVLCIFAGRQIVTKERLEVLALTVRKDIPDGQPVTDVIKGVYELGGIPVLPWAPGKWSGKRGRIVRRLLDAFKPGRLLVGDSTLRPTYWRKPALIRRARRSGFTVLAGSDPLPFQGDEQVAGSYASRITCDFRHVEPVTSLREALRNPETPVRNVPRPRGMLSVLRRFVRNELVRRATR